MQMRSLHHFGDRGTDRVGCHCKRVTLLLQSQQSIDVLFSGSQLFFNDLSRIDLLHSVHKFVQTSWQRCFLREHLQFGFGRQSIKTCFMNIVWNRVAKQPKARLRASKCHSRASIRTPSMSNTTALMDMLTPKTRAENRCKALACHALKCLIHPTLPGSTYGSVSTNPRDPACAILAIPRIHLCHNATTNPILGNQTNDLRMHPAKSRSPFPLRSMLVHTHFDAQNTVAPFRKYPIMSGIDISKQK